ncbi:hypothetical protein LOD31_01260 [Xylella fastidiosa subsp. multiplex]|nr:hypothetical protein [Xylella fastidiosa]MDD0871549.1 hypothetical protein [Xylella fastidiosa subsp. multiplex]
MQAQSGAMLIVLNPDWLCDAVSLWQCVSGVSHIKERRTRRGSPPLEGM